MPALPEADRLSQFTSFGALLRHLRLRAGLTQRELALAVGYSDGQISRLEQNRRAPDVATITARFVPALHLQREPGLVARLLELANPRQAYASRMGAGPARVHNLPAQLSRFVGREYEIAIGRQNLALAVGDLELARRRFEAIQVFADATGQSHARAAYYARHGRALLAIAQGNYAAGHRLLREALALWQAHADLWTIARLLDALATAAVGQYQHVRTARLLGASEALYAQIKMVLPPHVMDKRERAHAALRGQLDAASLAAAFSEGRAMTTEQAIAYALTEPAD